MLFVKAVSSLCSCSFLSEQSVPSHQNQNKRSISSRQWPPFGEGVAKTAPALFCLFSKCLLIYCHIRSSGRSFHSFCSRSNGSFVDLCQRGLAFYSCLITRVYSTWAAFPRSMGFSYVSCLLAQQSLIRLVHAFPQKG